MRTFSEGAQPRLRQACGKMSEVTDPKCIVHNLNVEALDPLISPAQLKAELPMSEAACQTVVAGREAVSDILEGRSDRLLIVVGPCSIHDEPAAHEYANRLKALSDRVADRLLIVMRVYFEKPRTTIGWKGLINDPHLDGTFDMTTGLRKARQLLLTVNEMGLPAATEMLDPITPQYLDDLITWASLGARTTESQTHRQMSSGLSMPIGYKNGTDGNLQTAVDAQKAALAQHHFLGINDDGQTCMVRTRGNRWGHMILRGGRFGPNYDPSSLENAATLLEKNGLPPRLMIDCNHANSGKQHKNQPFVWKSVLDQILGGDKNIIGMMLESNLHEGNQPFPADPARLSELQYGVSITDQCSGWEKTEELIDLAYDAMGK